MIIRILLMVVVVIAGLKLLTGWTDRKGWTSFYKLTAWRAIGMWAQGWDKYYRPNLGSAEQYKIEIHDEEDGEGGGKDPKQ